MINPVETGLALAAGFFFILTIVYWRLSKQKPPPKAYKRYVTEIPSKLIIEEESSS